MQDQQREADQVKRAHRCSPVAMHIPAADRTITYAELNVRTSCQCAGSRVTTITHAVAVEFLQRHDLRATARVEISGRLVGKQQFRLHHDAASDCNPLALPAGELVRLMAGAIGESQTFEHRVDRNPSLPHRDACEQQWQLDVFTGAEPGIK